MHLDGPASAHPRDRASRLQDCLCPAPPQSTSTASHDQGAFDPNPRRSTTWRPASHRAPPPGRYHHQSLDSRHHSGMEADCSGESEGTIWQEGYQIR